MPGRRGSYGALLVRYRHNINTNWYYELPFGRGRKVDFSNRVLNGILGAGTDRGRTLDQRSPSQHRRRGWRLSHELELGGNALTTGVPFQSGQFW